MDENKIDLFIEAMMLLVKEQRVSIHFYRENWVSVIIKLPNYLKKWKVLGL